MSTAWILISCCIANYCGHSFLFQELQKCFDEKDIPLLKETILKMDAEEAKYHMKRCVDSGLWVQDANKKGDEGDEGDDEEETYESVEKS